MFWSARFATTAVGRSFRQRAAVLTEPGWTWGYLTRRYLTRRSSLQTGQVSKKMSTGALSSWRSGRWRARQRPRGYLG